MELNRRELMKLLGVSGAATVAGAGAASLMLSVPDEMFQRISTGPRLETFKNSVCSFCPAGCGIRVRLIDGVPVRVTGNPDYPVNSGGVCPMAEASISAVFHPQRIQQPLRRIGKRGEDAWEPVSLEQAVLTIRERLQSLRDSGTPEKLALISSNRNTLTTEVSDRFFRAFGSPNFFPMSYSQVSSLPARLTQNITQQPFYDIPNADFVLNFGGDLLDEPFSPVRFNQFYAHLRSREDKPKGKIIHFSSGMSRTAANSTEWIPVEPGTMGALALSIAYVLIRDRSFNEDFLRSHCLGFFDWVDTTGDSHKGFESTVLEQYYPERAADLTGVSADKIVELARGFEVAEAAIAIPGTEAFFATNGLYTGWAIYCLNALKGNFNRPGGVLFPPQYNSQQPGDRSPFVQDGFPKGRIGTGWESPPVPVDSVEGFVAGLEVSGRESLDTLILQGGDVLFDALNRERFREQIEKIPFIVSCSSFMNETSRVLADLILPEPSLLESWEISCANPSVPFQHMAVQQPVLEPLYETISLGDLLLRIGRQIEGPVAEAMPWADYLTYLKDHAQEVFESGEGTVVSESMDYEWIEAMRARGWQALDYSNFEEFWEVLLERGGWWNPREEKRELSSIFRTESGKFEFYSTELRAAIDNLNSPDKGNSEQAESLNQLFRIEATGDQVYMPHFEPPRMTKSESRFQYTLLTFQRITNIGGEGWYLPLLQELSGLHSREYWNSWIEINPETAGALGIREHDKVAVTSPKGRVLTKARIVPTVMPNVVMMPAGLGSFEPQGSSQEEDSNPHWIFVEELDLLCGIPSRNSTRVRVEKVEHS